MTLGIQVTCPVTTRNDLIRRLRPVSASNAKILWNAIALNQIFNFSDSHYIEYRDFLRVILSKHSQKALSRKAVSSPSMA